MSNTPTLGDIARSYRTLAGLKQAELAALSERLTFAGTVSHALDQRRISRVETDEHVPTEDTLGVLAVVLAHALVEAGYEGSNADVILKHLRNVKQAGRAGMPADLAAFDAELAPYPGWYRRMILEVARAIHRIVSTAIDSTIRARKQRKPDTTSEDAD